MTKNYILKNIHDISSIDPLCANIVSEIFSDKTGIINTILRRFELEKYGLSMFQSLSAHSKILFNLNREVSSGGLGVNAVPQNALMACVGESLERYCMSYCDLKDQKYDKWENISKKHKIIDYDLYSDRQYSQQHIFCNPKKSKIFWTKVQGINNNSEIYWPSSLIYLPFTYGRPVAETSSTGVAANTDIDKAIHSGLLEIIERDALMINFLKNLKPLQIDIASINDRNSQTIGTINKSYNLRIYKLYSDTSIPIFLGLIWNKHKNNIYFGIGSSADLNSENAIAKTLKECLFTYFYSKHIRDLKVENKNNINKLYEHYLYYQGPRFYKLLQKSNIIKYSKEKCTIKQLLGELSDLNYHVYYKDLTTVDIKHTGFKVVKVIIPGFIDLNKSYGLRREGAKRFNTLPHALGIKTANHLSSMPHPFP